MARVCRGHERKWSDCGTVLLEAAFAISASGRSHIPFGHCFLANCLAKVGYRCPHRVLQFHCLLAKERKLRLGPLADFLISNPFLGSQSFHLCRIMPKMQRKNCIHFENSLALLP